MFRSVSLPRTVNGALFLHAMPGRYETWDIFLKEAARWKISLLISLAEEEEIHAKSPVYADAIRSNTLPCKRERFPIPDFGIPRDRKAFLTFATHTAERLRIGERILVHCGAGIGRTGMFAVTLLMLLGIQRLEAERAVAKAGSHPETKAQQEIVDWLEKILKTRKNELTRR